VRDRRHVTTAAQLAGEAFAHLRVATNSGRVRPALTVFAPTTPERPGPRIWNEQLIRYAGYRQPDGTVIGDPRYADFTSAVRDLGWPGGPGTPFDVLPLVVQVPGEGPALFDLPRDVVLEVPLSHPAIRGSPSWGCAGTPCPPSPTCAWRSAASATRPRPSTAGTWAPRSAPATWPTSTATTWSRWSPAGWASTPGVPPLLRNADLRPNYVHHPHTTDTMSAEV